MRFFVTLATIAFTAMPAWAALPPHYQRQDELIAILNEVVESFGIDHPIDSIVMKGPDFYEVRSGDCLMEVQVVDMPVPNAEPGWVGPRTFAIETGPLVCP